MVTTLGPRYVIVGMIKWFNLEDMSRYCNTTWYVKL
jgi:hypothetical protein